LRDDDMVLGLQWLDGEEASLVYGTTRVLAMMDNIHMDTQTKARTTSIATFHNSYLYAEKNMEENKLVYVYDFEGVVS
jgi:hypothetical protein